MYHEYMSKAVIIIGACIVLLMGGFYVLSTTDTTEAPVEHTETNNIYTNSFHGYSLQYPAGTNVTETSSESVTFGNEVEASIVNIEGEAGQSWQDVATDYLINMCAADGPTGSFTCTEAQSQQPVTSESGLEGFVIYLNGELQNFETDETTQEDRGPFFVFPLQTSATVSKILVVHPPLNQSSGNANSEMIRKIALSAEVIDSLQSVQTVEEYVADNISTLSPEKEVLGGTFYVTNIEAQDGSGTVEYEDGHIALTADFTYTTDEEGNVEVTSFDIR